MNTSFKTSIFYLVSIFSVLSLDAAPHRKRCPHVVHSVHCQAHIPTKKEIKAMEKQLRELINQERAKYRLPPLRELAILSHIATEHSANMAEGRVAFGHDGFNERAQTLMREKKHTSFGENVAYCFHVENPLQTIVAKWMQSPGHQENILGDYNETGIGIVYNKKGYCYMTQLFARRY